MRAIAAAFLVPFLARARMRGGEATVRVLVRDGGQDGQRAPASPRRWWPASTPPAAGVPGYPPSRAVRLPVGSRSEHPAWSRTRPATARAFPLYLLALACLLPAAHGASLELREGERIAVIGNAIAEALTAHGHFETLLASRFPELRVAVVGLGSPGDTLGARLSPLHAARLEAELRRQRAEVIIACFGTSESLDGPVGVPRFVRQLEDFVAAQRRATQGGRIVLVTPMVRERGGDRKALAARNADLRRYAQAMQQTARTLGVPCLDLLTPTGAIAAQGGAPLTVDGVQPTAFGSWVLGQLLMDALGYSARPVRIAIDARNAARPLTIDVALAMLPSPPAPTRSPLPKEFARRFPLVAVDGLEAGTWVLKANGMPVASGSAAAWKAGLPVMGGSSWERARQLYGTIHEKAVRCAERVRASDGAWLPARRPSPFAPPPAPGPAEALDGVITGLQQRAWELSQPPGPDSYELSLLPQ